MPHRYWFDDIRRHYNVPAKRGQRVLYKGRPGVITSRCGPYIRVRLDGEKRSRRYHPTWEMVYVSA